MANFKRRRLIQQFPERRLYKDGEIVVTTISDLERNFFRDWCHKRHLDDVYRIKALTYWIRVKSSVSVNFILDEVNRRLYMILCIHISLKWLGYDEEFKCNFVNDLRQELSSLRPDQHQDMEMELLRELNWKL